MSTRQGLHTKAKSFSSLTVLALACGSVTALAQKWELAAGFGGGENGDDRFFPAAVGHAALHESFFGRIYVHGQRSGIASNRSVLASVNYRATLPFEATKRFTANVGVAYLADTTRIAGTSKTSSLQSTSHNGGLALGVTFRVLTFSSWFVAADWQAHVFPAGWATIYLATGKRQFFSLITGVEL